MSKLRLFQPTSDFRLSLRCGLCQQSCAATSWTLLVLLLPFIGCMTELKTQPLKPNDNFMGGSL